MNNLRNKVQLIGNLGNDPEITNFESGKMLAKFKIATNEVAIEGKLTTRSWEDKDGMKRYITEVICSELLMLGK